MLLSHAIKGNTCLFKKSASNALMTTQKKLEVLTINKAGHLNATV